MGLQNAFRDSPFSLDLVRIQYEKAQDAGRDHEEVAVLGDF